MKVSHKELELQRKELELSREEFRGQKEQLKIQSETLKLQQFETTFFNMIKLYQDKLDSLYTQNIGKYERRGEDFFAYIISIIKSIQTFPDVTGELSNYWLMIKKYLNHLINVLEFIESSTITTNKNFYFNIIKSQISENEIDTIAYYRNYLSDEHKKLLIKYLAYKDE